MPRHYRSGAHAGAPLVLGALAVLPVRRVDRDDGLQRLGEGGDRLHGAPRVVAAGDRAGVVERAITGHG